MRLRRLDLTRFGKFTDRQLIFSPPGTGPDLHVVYGPNEAGKSTLLAGYLDLLFGIPQTSPYNFLHTYHLMQVGGCLELPSGPRELVRIKTRQNSLHDPAGQPVLDQVVLGPLGGLTRESYRAMFSLDDDTLEEGGRDILASRGALGELLFAATAGLADLSKSLDAVRGEIAAIRKPDGRVGELQDLKKQLDELKIKRTQIDITASEYGRKNEQRKRARDDHANAEAQLATVRTEEMRVGRLLAALPYAATLRARRAALADLPDLPAMPVEGREGLLELQRAEGPVLLGLQRAADAVQRLASDLDAVVVDEAALVLAEEAVPLTQLSARATAAAVDLPTQISDRAITCAAVAAVLTKMGEAGAVPNTRLLTDPQRAAFTAHLKRRSGIATKLDTAHDEFAAANQAVTEARGRLGPNAERWAADMVARVAAAREGWAGSDHRTRTAAETENSLATSDEFARHVTALAPWVGDGLALAGLTLPGAAVVKGWHEDNATRVDEVKRQQALVVQLTEALVPLRARQAVPVASAGLLTDLQAAEIRVARDAAWVMHRHTLDAATADGFEAALRHDDGVTARRLGQERALAALHQAERDIAGKEAEYALARTALGAAHAAADHGAEQLAVTLAAIDPALGSLPPAALLEWLRDRDSAVLAWQRQRAAERKLAQAGADASQLTQVLQSALAAAGCLAAAGASGDALAVTATTALNHQAKLQLLHDDLAKAEAELRRREAALAQAIQAEHVWMEAWQAACSDSWLGLEAANRPVETTEAIVALTVELGQQLTKHDIAALRIAEMEELRRHYAAEVERVAARLGLPREGLSITALGNAILTAIQQARLASENRVQLIGERGTARENELRAQNAKADHDHRAGLILRHLGVTTLIEAQERLTAIVRKAELEKQAAEAGVAMRNAMQATSLADAEARLDGQDFVALAAQQEALQAAHGKAQEHCQACAGAKAVAEGAILAVGSEDDVARLDAARRITQLEIADVAQRYLRLRIGLAAAERALHVYRDQHRGPMLDEASRAFAIISRGAYTSLRTRRGEGTDTLVACTADGGSKAADALSKGTRFQLYLALRAAGYRQFVAQHGAVPFIADDIMETFDDDRAEETFRVLGDMAAYGQVIYLTHHAHLIEIAKRTVPGVHTLQL